MKFIESVQNPTVKQWKKLHTKKEREKTNTFIVEGFHLVEEALKKSDVIQQVIIDQEAIVPASINLDHVETVYVTTQVMKAICHTETPQGIAAVCKQVTINKTVEAHEKWLFIDKVQDPGNIGTMIRTADCAGLDGVILGAGCADLYNSKTVRATQGSLFHLPVLRGDLSQWINKCKEKEIPVYGTSLKDGVPYQEIETRQSFALIVGNEGEGVSKEILQQTDENLYVPIYGQAESLNVALAAGILMYYLRG
jgi:RNA methyltransferase, TrmH family